MIDGALHLDIHTTIGLAALVCALVGGAMFRIAARYPAHLVTAIRLWGSSCLMAAVGAVLIYLRAHLPGLLSVVVANGVVVLSFALAYFAICQLTKERCRHAVLVWGWVVVSFAVYGYGYASGADLQTRVITVALMKQPILAVLVLALLTRRSIPDRAAFRAMAVLYGSYAVISLLRAGYTLDADQLRMPQLFADPIQQLSVVSFFLVLALSSVLFALALGAALNAALYRQASIDGLTGVFNRRTFEDLARREIARSARGGRAPAMLMVDVDHFKQINDRHGHLTGDEVLASVARMLAASLRQPDLIGRWGGEEFCILLPDTGDLEVHTVAERLRTCVAEGIEVAQAQTTITVTVSIGVVTPDQVMRDFNAMLQAADEALYRAKSEGRNRVVMAA